MLLNAGYDSPKPPGARGWDYDGSFKYGGKYFDRFGEPSAAYQEWKKVYLQAMIRATAGTPY
jgi:hypothetical protein